MSRAGDFPPALPIPAFQLGAFSHKDVVSEVPSSLLSHSGKESNFECGSHAASFLPGTFLHLAL